MTPQLLIPAGIGSGLLHDRLRTPDRAPQLRWSWSCRHMSASEPWALMLDLAPEVCPGDLAAVRVDAIGEHARIVTTDNRRLRIYPGDLVVGVFGNRYATDAFEAEVDGVSDLSVVTGAGMIGTVRSRHRRVGSPTRVTFAGFVQDEAGVKVNLKDRFFRPRPLAGVVAPTVAIVGSGMNSGKTTSSVSLIKGLSSRGLRVGACKLTGSVSNRDQDEMRAAAATTVVDFSDYGFPSTYLCPPDELLALWQTMIADVQATSPDVIVMEVADGVLQRETALLLRHDAFRRSLAGVIVAADSAPSALYAVAELESLGHHVIAVSGVLTSSPLYVHEFHARCRTPVGASMAARQELVDLLLPVVRPAA